jgi:hypothetical protein
MSQEDVEVVRAIYEALAAKGWPPDLIAADIEYVNPPYAVEVGRVGALTHSRASLRSTRIFAWKSSDTSTQGRTWS